MNLTILQPFGEKCDGKASKCTSCNNQGYNYIETVEANSIGPDPPNWLDTLLELWDKVSEYVPGSTQPSTSPTCDLHSVSKILFNVFGNGVYKSFCDTVGRNAKSQLSQIVDAPGNVVPHKVKRAVTKKRTLPADLDAGDGYTFDLQWIGGDGGCSSGCKDAFDTMVKSLVGLVRRRTRRSIGRRI